MAPAPSSSRHDSARARSSSCRELFPWITWMNTVMASCRAGHLRVRWSRVLVGDITRSGTRPPDTRRPRGPPGLPLTGRPAAGSPGVQPELLERHPQGDVTRPLHVDDRILERNLDDQPVEQGGPQD